MSQQPKQLEELNPTTLDEIEYLLLNVLTDEQFYKFIQFLYNIYLLNIHTPIFKDFLFIHFENYATRKRSPIAQIFNHPQLNNEFLNKHYNVIINNPKLFLQNIKDCYDANSKLITNQKKIFLNLYCNFDKDYIIPFYPNFSTQNGSDQLETNIQLQYRIRFYTEILYSITSVNFNYHQYEKPRYTIKLNQYFKNYLTSGYIDPKRYVYPVVILDNEYNQLVELFDNMKNSNYALYIKNILLGSLYINENGNNNLLLKTQLLNYFKKINLICDEFITIADIKYLFYHDPAKNTEHFMSHMKYYFIEAILIPFTNKIYEELDDEKVYSEFNLNEIIHYLLRLYNYEVVLDINQDIFNIIDKKNQELENKRLQEIERIKEKIENERLQEIEKLVHIRLQQIELERLQQIELEKLQQIELERLQQIELERLQQIEIERLQQIELEELIEIEKLQELQIIEEIEIKLFLENELIELNRLIELEQEIEQEKIELDIIQILLEEQEYDKKEQEIIEFSKEPEPEPEPEPELEIEIEEINNNIFMYYKILLFIFALLYCIFIKFILLTE